MTTVKMFSKIGKESQDAERREASIKKLEFERKKSLFEGGKRPNINKSESPNGCEVVDHEDVDEAYEDTMSYEEENSR